MNIINIFVDGACSGNPGAGGYGVINLEESEDSNIVLYLHKEYSENTTNNREELKAVIHAFEIAESRFSNNICIIHSDSSYVVNICNDWIYKWVINNWKNSKNEIVENLDLIQTLYKYISKDFFNCQVVKTKGHCGILGNELADALASNNQNKFDKLCKENNIILALF